MTRSKLAIFSLFALIFPSASCPAETVTPSRPGSVDFTIFRNDAEVGGYAFEVTDDGESRIVQASMRVEVKLFRVPIYRATHERREVWKNGRLVSFTGRSRYNGTSYEMELTRDGKAATLEVNGVAQKIDSDCFTFVPWLVDGSDSAVLITEKGRVVKISQIDLGQESLIVNGKETKLRHYLYRGVWERHAWYDEKGSLVLMTYEKDGAKIRLSWDP